MDTPRTTQTVGLCALFGLILALVLGIAAVAASMDEIGRSAWAGGIALLVSGGAVVILSWRFNVQWQRACGAPGVTRRANRAASLAKQQLPS